MSQYADNYISGNHNFWRYVEGTDVSAGVTVLAAKVGFRPIVEGYRIAVTNGAGAQRMNLAFRNPGSPPVDNDFAAVELAASGVVNVESDGAKYQGASGDAVVVVGSTTTRFAVSLYGRWVRDTDGRFDKYTGAP